MLHASLNEVPDEITIHLRNPVILFMEDRPGFLIREPTCDQSQNAGIRYNKSPTMLLSFLYAGKEGGAESKNKINAIEPKQSNQFQL